VKFLLDHDVPDDVGFSLEALGHALVKVREVVPITTSDDEVLHWATARACVLITCNRDDFIVAAERIAHHGIIILIRRKSRALERAALVRLLDSAGESGLTAMPYRNSIGILGARL
jgi:predicted nuclease of predicted toxin-antitoxin system